MSLKRWSRPKAVSAWWRIRSSRRASWTRFGSWVAASKAARRRRTGTASSLPTTRRSRNRSTLCVPARSRDIGASRGQGAGPGISEAVRPRASLGDRGLPFQDGGVRPLELFPDLRPLIRGPELPGQVFLEELQDTAAVLVAGQVQGLVVFGPLDQPELARLAGLLVQHAGHLRLDVGVAAAVDQQQRPRRQLLHLPLQVQEAAPPRPPDAADGDHAELAVVPRRQQRLQEDPV